jgi:spectrin beta
MKEKYNTATDESYRDLTNLPEKLKKHQAFEAELKANNERLKDINEVITNTVVGVKNYHIKIV